MLSLAGEGPDLMACETVPCLPEVQALLELIEEPEYQKNEIPAWISVSCKDGEHLNSGETVQQLIDSVKPKQREFQTHQTFELFSAQY